MKLLPFFFAGSLALIAQSAGNRSPGEKHAWSGEDIQTIGQNLDRALKDSLARARMVRAELAVEESRPVLDALALGARYVELITIRREAGARYSAGVADVQQALTPASRQRLEALSTASGLRPEVVEAVCAYALAPGLDYAIGRWTDTFGDYFWSVLSSTSDSCPGPFAELARVTAVVEAAGRESVIPARQTAALRRLTWQPALSKLLDLSAAQAARIEREYQSLSVAQDEIDEQLQELNTSIGDASRAAVPDAGELGRLLAQRLLLLREVRRQIDDLRTRVLAAMTDAQRALWRRLEEAHALSDSLATAECSGLLASDRPVALTSQRAYSLSGRYNYHPNTCSGLGFLTPSGGGPAPQ